MAASIAAREGPPPPTHGMHRALPTYPSLGLLPRADKLASPRQVSLERGVVTHVPGFERHACILADVRDHLRPTKITGTKGPPDAVSDEPLDIGLRPAQIRLNAQLAFGKSRHRETLAARALNGEGACVIDSPPHHGHGHERSEVRADWEASSSALGTRELLRLEPASE